MSDVLQFYWESPLKGQDLVRQQALWHLVLGEHTAKTIHAVAADWLKNGKRKPLPADFLGLADELDSTPEKIRRLKKLINLPVKSDAVYREPGQKTKLIGDPVKLSEMIGYAKSHSINFGENQQMLYLNSGVVPDWFVDIKAPQKFENIPTRDELLAQMTPEMRLAALAK